MDFKDFKERYQKKEVLVFPSSTPKDPLVSVLVQTYLQKDFIKECLDSILMQETSFAFEILVGEDGSDDGTRDICIEYAEEYPEKIRLFLHNRENQILINGEPTSNFNALYNFFSSRGDFIFFCEGDDFWGDKLKLHKQVTFLQKNKEFSFSYHRFLTIDVKGEKIIEKIKGPEQNVNSQDLLEGRFHPLLLTVCFRKVFQEIPVQLTEVINVDTFFFSLLGEIGMAKFHKEILPSCYRRHNNGIWGKRSKRKKFGIKHLTYQKLSDYYKTKGNKILFHYYRKKSISILKSEILYLVMERRLMSAGKLLTNHFQYFFFKIIKFQEI